VDTVGKDPIAGDLATAQDGVMSTPEEQATPPISVAESWPRLRGLVRRSGRVLGYGLLALVALLVFNGMTDPYSSSSIDPGFIFAVALVGAGVLLLRGQEPVATEGARVRTSRPKSPLGILTLSVAFCLCGLLILLGNLGVSDVGVGQITAAGLAVTGLGLLVGAWWGRSRLLILVGLALLPVVVITGFIHFPLRGYVGSREVYADTIADVDPSYEMLVGTMSVDLLSVKDFPAQMELDFDVAAGRVTIYVPERLGVKVNGNIEWGNAVIGRGREEGDGLQLDNEVEGKPGAGILEVNFDGGIASLYVERISRREMYGPPPRRERQRIERRREARQELRREAARDRRAEATRTGRREKRDG
jgi:hypothetical protein